ncbi:MAG: HlyD family efflux transporter periplasmic adaptor subunit [Rhodopila sp.]|jgi:multidrug resistance efflux pump
MAVHQLAPNSDALSLLLGLVQRLRRAVSADEVAFIMVNETIMLAPYRQALLWRDKGGVAAVSGLAVIDRNAPFVLWTGRLCRAFGDGLDRPRKITAADIPAAVAEDWDEWLPEHCLALPLRTPAGARLGLLLFVRDAAWSEGETLFLADAAETGALAWAYHLRPGALREVHDRWVRIPLRRWLAAVAILAVAMIPVHLSVLAQGEVVAHDPAVVRAPLEGVVEHVLVTPNEAIEAGQLLFELDTSAIRGKLVVAQKALQTARAEYEQAAQQAFSDMKAKAQLGVLSAHIEERRADVAYLSDQLARSRVVAPRPGVAVLDDPSEWVGKPVSVGERVLSVADEHDTEVEAWLAPGDVIDLPVDAPVTLFLNVDPIHPVHAALRYIGYETLMRPDGTLAHRVRASLPETQEKPRLGLKGTVRLDGDRVPLAYWLLRRPLVAARQMFGL